MSMTDFCAFRISTHTPHAGRDRSPQVAIGAARHFNSHAPCGARRAGSAAPGTVADFNSHAPCGARHTGARGVAPGSEISTHTPHAGRDADRSDRDYAGKHFNSHAPCGARPGLLYTDPAHPQFQLTRPMRGATYEQREYPASMCISTHTPHAGRDPLQRGGAFGGKHFNSHAPCGARPTPGTQKGGFA